MTYTDADTSFHALPADIRARVAARVGKPPRPMSTMEVMLVIGQEIVAERERCAIPDGWVLVPKEPTPEMIKAGEDWSGLPSATWADMLDAAPPAGDETE